MRGLFGARFLWEKWFVAWVREPAVKHGEENVDGEGPSTKGLQWKTLVPTLRANS